MSLVLNQGVDFAKVYNRGSQPGVLVPLGGTRLVVKGYEDHWPQSSSLNGFVEKTIISSQKVCRKV